MFSKFYCVFRQAHNIPQRKLYKSFISGYSVWCRYVHKSFTTRSISGIHNMLTTNNIVKPQLRNKFISFIFIWFLYKNWVLLKTLYVFIINACCCCYIVRDIFVYRFLPQWWWWGQTRTIPTRICISRNQTMYFH